MRTEALSRGGLGLTVLNYQDVVADAHSTICCHGRGLRRQFLLLLEMFQCWWAGRESNPQSFRGGFTDRWARHVPFADPARREPGDSVSYPFPLWPPVSIMAA